MAYRDILAGLLVAITAYFSGHGIQESIGISFVVMGTILLGIDMMGFGKYREELKQLTSGGLWVRELETLSDSDLDGDNEVG